MCLQTRRRLIGVHANGLKPNVNQSRLIGSAAIVFAFGETVMRRITVLAAAGVVSVAVGVISFMLGRAPTIREPVSTVMPAKVAESTLVTGAISSRQIPLQVQQQAPSASARPVAFLPPGRSAAIPTSASAIPDSPSPSCGNTDALGVSRVVEIDTVGGPGFGFEQFKAYDFLREQEVVLTFDDGPWPGIPRRFSRPLQINAPRLCSSPSASMPCGIPKSSSRWPRRDTQSDRIPGRMPICPN